MYACDSRTLSGGKREIARARSTDLLYRERVITIRSIAADRDSPMLARGSGEDGTKFNYPPATIGESSSALSPRDEIDAGDISANLLETRRFRRVSVYRLKVSSTAARG